MNDIDSQAWLADVLACMPNLSVSRLPELLPWNWRQPLRSGRLPDVPRGEDDRPEPRADRGGQLELRQHRLRRDVQDGTEEGITTFTDRGIESLPEFLADVRTWNGGIRQFLIDQQCEPDVIERIMAKEQKS